VEHFCVKFVIGKITDKQTDRQMSVKPYPHHTTAVGVGKELLQTCPRSSSSSRNFLQIRPLTYQLHQLTDRQTDRQKHHHHIIINILKWPE